MTDLARNQGSTAPHFGETCRIPMIDDKPCGRPSVGPLVKGVPYCLMHTPLAKNNAAFQEEFERILAEAGTGNADFTRFVFPNANYQGREFKADCTFGAAKFTQDVNFTDAVFTRDVNFVEATFTEDTKFTNATFKEDANFTDASFTQNVEFRGVNFEKNANFSAATLTRAVSFKGTAFLAAATFRETKFRQDTELFPGPMFSLAEFFRPEAVVFYKTYLGQALFHNCDVSKLVFSSVEWRKRRNGDQRTGKRMVFEEEVILDDAAAKALRPKEGSEDERDFSLIADLYHQLKKNYDECRDYWTAGDFHYGEMEMKRLSSRAPNFGLIAWYKYVSHYGESYVRPVVALLFVLAVFMLLFPLAGLDLNENPSRPVAALPTQQTPPPTRISELSYRRFADFVAPYRGGKWVGCRDFFGNSLMTVLSVAGFQRELKYEPSHPWGRVLAMLELVLTSTLIALFLLAVRRQFRR